MASSLTSQIVGFVQDVVNAMGMTMSVNIEETPEGTRINLDGEDGGVLVRRGGEGLQALQHIVATTFRKQLGDDNRIVIDCNGYRKEKDAELRQMDRKSTRLNSSHEWISYAVFCLKKKKNKHEEVAMGTVVALTDIALD